MVDEPLEPGEAESRDVVELLSVLDLEELDRDIFRGLNPRGSARRPRLFGGQVAAQAARAASLTVPNDRLLHSLHGYFLRGGQADRPTILHVDRDRDGRSFSARHVTARQDGKVIMSLLVSFTVDEDGREFQMPSLVGSVPPPEEVPAADANSVHHSIFDLRVLGLGPTTGAFWRTPHRYWARARGALPDDPLLHGCVLAYLSDIGTGLAKLEDERPRGGPSLDHAVWFHRPARMDEWVLVELLPVAAAGGRGFYTGVVHDRDGRLLATIAQEHVSRDMDLG
ncbi:MAG: acyl-CoA thioesterase [Actinomycetota bacterium]|jgi:acyl-CoA thioesterase-2|nr:acyl-CoA thioesterase [Actinomycetota bacterium]